ncbi:lipopolysaccharide biosynthesis protein [Arenimonas maotaiensis]|uniref:lipopolysaccharide biosynthesis protein n=1 Tax=Arenimonas maotaiensis TaxID=1446479 RepID=UPI0031B83EE0
MTGLHNAIRNSNFWSLVKLLTSLSVGFFITTYIVRTLGVHEYGVYSVLFSLIGIVAALASFGIQDVFRRFIPEALQQNRVGLLIRLVSYGLLVRMVSSVLVVVIIWILSDPVGRFLKIPDFSNYFMVFGVGIVAYLEAGLLTVVLHSTFLHKYSAISNAIYVLMRGGMALVVLESGYGVTGLLWVEALSWSAWAIIQWIFYKKAFPSTNRLTQDENLDSARIIKYGGMSSLNDIGGSILGVSTDFIIITAYLGPSAVALYAFSDRVIKMINNCLPHAVLADVIRTSFFSKYAQSQNPVDLEKMFNLVLKISGVALIPIAFGIFVLSDTLITYVFKDDYLEAESIFWLLALFSVINMFAYPTGLVLQAIEKVSVILYSKVFAVLNILLSIVAVKKYGVMGVVISTCICTFFKNYYCFYRMNKSLKIDVDWTGIAKIASSSLGMCLVIIFLRNYVTGLVSLSTVILFSAIVYYLAIRIFSPFTSGERHFINRVVPGSYSII